MRRVVEGTAPFLTPLQSLLEGYRRSPLPAAGRRCEPPLRVEQHVEPILPALIAPGLAAVQGALDLADLDVDLYVGEIGDVSENGK